MVEQISEREKKEIKDMKKIWRKTTHQDQQSNDKDIKLKIQHPWENKEGDEEQEK